MPITKSDFIPRKRAILFNFEQKEIKKRRPVSKLSKDVLFYNKHNNSKKVNQKNLSKAFNTIFYLVVISALLSGIYYALVKSTYFKVADIQIVGASKYVNYADLLELTKNQAFGKSIFFLNPTNLKETLQKTFLSKSIQVIKIYPHTIKLLVTQRVPIALIYNKDSLDLYVIDSEGFVLGIVDSQSLELPKIQYDGEIKVSYFISKALVPIYNELMLALANDNVLASSVSFSSSYTKIYVKEGVEVLIANDKNKKEAIDTVSALLKNLSLDGKKVTKIDLRYDKVIVSYE